MKKMTALALLTGFLCFSVTAQKISNPVLTAKLPTDAQKLLIQQGIALHDAKKFDAAIAKYSEVLDENPDCTLALYELALSYYNKPDKEKAMETALKGTQYKSTELPLFYGIVANVIDDRGNPKGAVRLYEEAIKIIRKEKDLEQHVSSLYYNLGVTYTQQKQFNEARAALKKAVEYNFAYASPHYVLAEVFYSSKYQVPALLAAGRLLTLEINSQRSKRATATLMNVLKAPQQDEKGNTTIFMNLGAPTDEGDFGAAELILGMGGIRTEEDKGKSDNDLFAEKVGLMIGLLIGDKKLNSTFVGKNYLPFLSEMKSKGFVKHFAYLILQQNGDQQAEKWLASEGQKTVDFINWAKSYQPAK